MLWPWTVARKFGESPVDQCIGGLGRSRFFRPTANRLSRRALVFHLMQLPEPGGDIFKTGGERQNRNRIRMGLTKRRHRVGQSWPRNHIGYARFASGPRIPIRHERRAPFMAGQNMRDARLFDAAIHLLVMHAGNAKNHLDPARFEHMRDLRPQGSFHRLRPSRIE